MRKNEPGKKSSRKKDRLRSHPLEVDPIKWMPQNPERHRSHDRPPTPGKQRHCKVVASHSSSTEPESRVRH